MDDDKEHKPKSGGRRKETPRSGLEENLPYRIEGLQKVKMEPGMSPQDIAALDRVIVKLQAKLAEKREPKRKEDDED